MRPISASWRSAVFAAVVSACVAGGAAGGQEPALLGRVAALEARATLIDIANALDAAVDAKDWDRARSYFADDVRVDFSSLGAGDPTTMPSDALIDGWRTNLFDGKSSFHLRGNHQVAVDGDRATMTSHGYAWNLLPELEGGELWEVWGVYDYTFARDADVWLITGFAFKATHQRGNPAVPGAPRN